MTVPYSVCPVCEDYHSDYRYPMNRQIVQVVKELDAAENGELMLRSIHGEQMRRNMARVKMFGLATTDGRGKWTITRLGSAFARGYTPIPAYVWTYKSNAFKSEGDLVYAGEVTCETWSYQRVPHPFEGAA